MTSLEWNLLAEKFYAFKNIADKHGFYVPETNQMENSLTLMRPYPGDNERARELANKKDAAPQLISDWHQFKAAHIVFDDDDNLAGVD